MLSVKDTTYTPIFSYGILRKKGWLNNIIKTYGLKGVKIMPSAIEGFVPYNSNGINMIFPVTQKQRDKYTNFAKDNDLPLPSFRIYGSLVYFYGDEDKVKKLKDYIDLIEGGYEREILETIDGTKCIVYTMDNFYKQHKIINFYGIGLVIYPDSILRPYYMAYDLINDSIAEYELKYPTEAGIEQEYIYDYERGRVSKEDYIKEEYNDRYIDLL